MTVKRGQPYISWKCKPERPRRSGAGNIRFDKSIFAQFHAESACILIKSAIQSNEDVSTIPRFRRSPGQRGPLAEQRFRRPTLLILPDNRVQLTRTPRDEKGFARRVARSFSRACARAENRRAFACARVSELARETGTRGYL